MYAALRSIAHTISIKAVPAMIRVASKARKIAWAILGRPANQLDKKSAAQKKVDEELASQRASRSR
jgi:hypothetical protein